MSWDSSEEPTVRQEIDTNERKESDDYPDDERPNADEGNMESYKFKSRQYFRTEESPGRIEGYGEYRFQYSSDCQTPEECNKLFVLIKESSQNQETQELKRYGNPYATEYREPDRSSQLTQEIIPISSGNRDSSDRRMNRPRHRMDEIERSC